MWKNQSKSSDLMKKDKQASKEQITDVAENESL